MHTINPYEALTEDIILEKLNKSRKQAAQGMYKDATEVSRDIREIQQSLNVEGLPFIVTKNSKEALREQSIAMLMLDLKRAEERAETEGWIDAEDLEKELGVLD